MESRADEGHPMSEQEIADFPHKDVVTRALGTNGEVQIETRRLPIGPADRLLLASASVPEPAESIVREPPIQPPHDLAVKVATNAALAAPGRAIAVAVVQLAR
jgi:hypothetical protein